MANPGHSAPRRETPREPQSRRDERSSLGIDENLAGALAYFGLFISGIILLVLEKRSSFVRFHALQSTVTFGSLIVLRMVLGWLPVIGSLVSFLVPLATVVLWVVFMVKAYQGERWQLPIIGEIAEERSRRS